MVTRQGERAECFCVEKNQHICEISSGLQLPSLILSWSLWAKPVWPHVSFRCVTQDAQEPVSSFGALKSKSSPMNGEVSSYRLENQVLGQTRCFILVKTNIKPGLWFQKRHCFCSIPRLLFIFLFHSVPARRRETLAHSSLHFHKCSSIKLQHAHSPPSL